MECKRLKIGVPKFPHAEAKRKNENTELPSCHVKFKIIWFEAIKVDLRVRY